MFRITYNDGDEKQDATEFDQNARSELLIAQFMSKYFFTTTLLLGAFLPSFLLASTNHFACDVLLTNDLSGYYLVTRSEGLWPPEGILPKQNSTHRHYPVGLKLALHGRDSSVYLLEAVSTLVEPSQAGFQTNFLSRPSRGVTQFSESDLLVIRKISPDLVVLAFEDSRFPSPILLKEKIGLDQLVKTAQFIPVYEIFSASMIESRLKNFELKPFLKGQKVFLKTGERHSDEHRSLELDQMNFQILKRGSLESNFSSNKNEILPEIRNLDFSKISGSLAPHLLFARSLDHVFKLEFDFSRPISAEDAKTVFSKQPLELWTTPATDSNYIAAVVELSVRKIIKILEQNPQLISTVTIPFPPLHVHSVKFDSEK